MNVLNAKTLPCSPVESPRESFAVLPNNPKRKVKKIYIDILGILLLIDIYLIISFQRSSFKVGGRKKRSLNIIWEI